jgi:hypothetical protein
MGKALTGKVVALAGRLPQIWTDPDVTDAHRKALLRCLVDKVVLDRTSESALVRIVWRGGAVTELDVKMRVTAIAKLARGGEMRARLLDLAKEGRHDNEIAHLLTEEGHRSANCADKVLPVTVQRIRLAEGIKAPPSRRRWEHDPNFLSTTELAAKLEIPVNWLYVQIKNKRLLIEPQPTGAYLFPDTPAVLDGVQNLRNHVIGELDLRICQPDNGGYQHG